MAKRRDANRARAGAFGFFVVFIAALPCLGETETEAKDPQGLLPVPDYSGDVWSQSHLMGDWGGVRNDLPSKASRRRFASPSSMVATARERSTAARSITTSSWI